MRNIDLAQIWGSESPRTLYGLIALIVLNIIFGLVFLFPEFYLYICSIGGLIIVLMTYLMIKNGMKS